MYEKEKRRDRNPASFKIQYPMKNRDKNNRSLADLQVQAEKFGKKTKRKAKVDTLARF
jgi:hypothetical protein